MNGEQLQGTKHFNICITGRVQMVFFRFSAKEKAERLDIRGFARNEPDGSVYIEAEGDENALKKFIYWCRSGPPSAKVEKIKTQDAELKNFTAFHVQ